MSEISLFLCLQQKLLPFNRRVGLGELLAPSQLPREACRLLARGAPYPSGSSPASPSFVLGTPVPYGQKSNL